MQNYIIENTVYLLINVRLCTWCRSLLSTVLHNAQNADGISDTKRSHNYQMILVSDLQSASRSQGKNSLQESK